ncbi:MAG: hypothetical protein QW282_06955 [Nitrososphaerales archaeon]
MVARRPYYVQSDVREAARLPLIETQKFDPTWWSLRADTRKDAVGASNTTALVEEESILYALLYWSCC